jgi:hypothetical protein
MSDESQIQLIQKLVNEYKATFGLDPFPSESQPWAERDEDETRKALQYALEKDLPLQKQ